MDKKSEFYGGKDVWDICRGIFLEEYSSNPLFKSMIDTEGYCEVDLNKDTFKDIALKAKAKLNGVRSESCQGNRIENLGNIVTRVTFGNSLFFEGSLSYVGGVMLNINRRSGDVYIYTASLEDFPYSDEYAIPLILPKYGDNWGTGKASVLLKKNLSYLKNLFTGDEFEDYLFSISEHEGKTYITKFDFVEGERISHCIDGYSGICEVVNTVLTELERTMKKEGISEIIWFPSLYESKVKFRELLNGEYLAVVI